MYEKNCDKKDYGLESSNRNLIDHIFLDAVLNKNL
jgi:hypothetical protein